MTFLGRRFHGKFEGEVATDQRDQILRGRVPGRRVKHRIKQSWLKTYDKASLVLRVETVINQPEEFRVRRRVRRRGRRRQSHNVARSDRCREQEGRHEHCHSQDIGRGSTRGADTAPLAVVQTGSLRARAASRRASRGGDRACDALHRRYGGRGVALAAAGYGLGTAGAKLALRDGGRAEATVWGFGRKARAVDVALANGMLSHAMDYDDTNTAAIMHASSVVVPTAIAVGGRIGASGLEVLASAIMGCSVALMRGGGLAGRLPMAYVKRIFFRRPGAWPVWRIPVAQVESRQVLRWTVELGVRYPLYAGAASKVLLAFLSEDELAEIRRGLEFKPLAPNTLRSWNALCSDLDQVRREIVAVSAGETVEGAAGVAGPVRDATQANRGRRRCSRTRGETRRAAGRRAFPRGSEDRTQHLSELGFYARL